jgi:spore coat protein H
MKRSLLLLFSLPFFLPAQNPFPALGPVFKDDVIPRIDILIPPDSLDILLAPGNEQSNYHWHATFIFDNGELKDTVENIGFRLRGNTSRYSAKKSFKVSFNTYEPGRNWEGLDKLNLNGEHNDPTIARSKACWDMLSWMEVPAPRANHVELYINGQFRGLYANVEHIDEEFAQLRYGNNDGNLYKCLYPADLVYKGPNPDLYKQEYGGRRAYQLTINEEIDDYSDLAHFIDVLNNTPLNDLPCELEKVFEVGNYLRAMAFDILSGNWDGPIYNKNNFYLYHNLATGKFEYIPYDLDNTLGIDWLGKDWGNLDIYNWKPGEPRPLYTRLLAVPAYRDRFSYYMKKFIEGAFSTTQLFPYLDNLKALISPSAQADPFRPLDYGFTYAQFLSSFESALPFFHTPYGIKPYIIQRRNTALQQLVLNDISPIISQVKNNHPSAYQDIYITAHAEDDGALGLVELCYQIDGQNLSCIPMTDDGNGQFSALIPALNQPALFEYYVRAADDAGQESVQPVCGLRSVYIGAVAVPLVVNELMASNSSTIADEAGEYDDWLEIFSLSDVPLYLGNYFLSDNENNPTKWPMPDFWIQPGQYLVFWADEDQEQGELHTNFKLSADGEFIGIFSDQGLIDGIAFGPQETDAAFGRIPNGTGPFVRVGPTPGAVNQAFSSVSENGEAGLKIVLYPNPTAGALTVEWGSPAEAQIQVWSASGVRVYAGVHAGGAASLDLNGIMPGVYWVQVVGENRGEGVEIFEVRR